MFIFAGFCLVYVAGSKIRNFHSLRNFATGTVEHRALQHIVHSFVFYDFCFLMIYIYIYINIYFYKIIIIIIIISVFEKI